MIFYDSRSDEEKGKEVQYFNVGSEFTKGGCKYIVTDKDDTFTFCDKIPNDGIRYGFVKGVKVD